jgi:hypothetical protein
MHLVNGARPESGLGNSLSQPVACRRDCTWRERIRQIHAGTLDSNPLFRGEPEAGLPDRVPPYRRIRDEICGFDLCMVDGTVITLYHGDAGFENVAGELSEQGIVLALGAAPANKLLCQVSGHERLNAITIHPKMRVVVKIQ